MCCGISGALGFAVVAVEPAQGISKHPHLFVNNRYESTYAVYQTLSSIVEFFFQQTCIPFCTQTWICQITIFERNIIHKWINIQYQCLITRCLTISLLSMVFQTKWSQFLGFAKVQPGGARLRALGARHAVNGPKPCRSFEASKHHKPIKHVN